MPSLRKHRSAPGHLTSFVESRQQLESNAMVNARTIIHRGFNEGTNMFDLSSLNLVRLPEDIADIQYLTFASNKASGPFSSNNIQLYLANNSLTRLPPCIYNLVNVTVLSLRGNNLKELPSSIANLVNLTELSVSSNQLRMLPAELLKLPKLENLGASPNPFVEESVVQVDRRLHNSNTTLREISLRKLVKLAPRHITTANQDITLQLRFVLDT
eukprot:CFRG4267T1